MELMRCTRTGDTNQSGAPLSLCGHHYGKRVISGSFFSLSLDTLMRAPCIISLRINLQYVRIYPVDTARAFGFDTEEDRNI